MLLFCNNIQIVVYIIEIYLYNIYCVRHHCFILKYSVSVHVLYTSDYIIFNLYNLSNAFLSKSASVIYSFLSLSMSF